MLEISEPCNGRIGHAPAKETSGFYYYIDILAFERCNGGMVLTERHSHREPARSMIECISLGDFDAGNCCETCQFSCVVGTTGEDYRGEFTEPIAIQRSEQIALIIINPRRNPRRDVNKR